MFSRFKYQINKSLILFFAIWFVLLVPAEARAQNSGKILGQPSTPQDIVEQKDIHVRNLAVQTIDELITPADGKRRCAARLTWQHPANGTNNFVSYQIRVPGNIFGDRYIQAINKNATSHDISGLNCGEKYDFIVNSSATAIPGTLSYKDTAGTVGFAKVTFTLAKSGDPGSGSTLQWDFDITGITVSKSGDQCTATIKWSASEASQNQNNGATYKVLVGPNEQGKGNSYASPELPFDKTSQIVDRLTCSTAYTASVEVYTHKKMVTRERKGFLTPTQDTPAGTEAQTAPVVINNLPKSDVSQESTEIATASNEGVCKDRCPGTGLLWTNAIGNAICVAQCTIIAILESALEWIVDNILTPVLGLGSGRPNQLTE